VSSDFLFSPFPSNSYGVGKALRGQTDRPVFFFPSFSGDDTVTRDTEKGVSSTLFSFLLFFLTKAKHLGTGLTSINVNRTRFLFSFRVRIGGCAGQPVECRCSIIFLSSSFSPSPYVRGGGSARGEHGNESVAFFFFSLFIFAGRSRSSRERRRKVPPVLHSVVERRSNASSPFSPPLSPLQGPRSSN